MPRVPREPQQPLRARALGRTRYVLLVGVAGWGLPMFVYMMLLRPWIGGHAQEISARHLAIGALTWAVAGAAFGLFMWHVGRVAPQIQDNERTKQ
ncbi:hypothetical protein [Lysobacter claricitrinus]|uniref:hypothetical protein n=1 Tax=Lysobacter claricitrinus TaxID=3367728 RepID=UPI0037DBEC77